MARLVTQRRLPPQPPTRTAGSAQPLAGPPVRPVAPRAPQPVGPARPRPQGPLAGGTPAGQPASAKTPGYAYRGGGTMTFLPGTSEATKQLNIGRFAVGGRRPTGAVSPEQAPPVPGEKPGGVGGPLPPISAAAPPVSVPQGREALGGLPLPIPSRTGVMGGGPLPPIPVGPPAPVGGQVSPPMEGLLTAGAVSPAAALGGQPSGLPEEAAMFGQAQPSGPFGMPGQLAGPSLRGMGLGQRLYPSLESALIGLMASKGRLF